MKATRLLTHAVVVGGILGAALMLGADAMVSSAEARDPGRRYQKPRIEHRSHRHYRSHHRPVAVRHHRAHRVQRVYRVPARPHRPWYVGARRVYVHDSPFYFHAGLNVFLGGVELGLHFGNVAPAGYVYVDPYCDLEFYSVDAYYGHLHRHAHRPTLWVAQVCAY